MQKKSALSALIELQERQLKDSVLLNIVPKLRNKKKNPLSLKENISSIIAQGSELALSAIGYKWIKNFRSIRKSKLIIGIATLIITKIVRRKLSTHHLR